MDFVFLLRLIVETMCRTEFLFSSSFFQTCQYLILQSLSRPMDRSEAQDNTNFDPHVYNGGHSMIRVDLNDVWGLWALVVVTGFVAHLWHHDLDLSDHLFLPFGLFDRLPCFDPALLPPPEADFGL